MANSGKFWHWLAKSGQIWQNLAKSGKIWRNLSCQKWRENARKCPPELLAKSIFRWQNLAKSGEIWRSLANLAHCHCHIDGAALSIRNEIRNMIDAPKISTNTFHNKSCILLCKRSKLFPLNTCNYLSTVPSVSIKFYFILFNFRMHVYCKIKCNKLISRHTLGGATETRIKNTDESKMASIGTA